MPARHCACSARLLKCLLGTVPARHIYLGARSAPPCLAKFSGMSDLRQPDRKKQGGRFGVEPQTLSPPDPGSPNSFEPKRNVSPPQLSLSGLRCSLLGFPGMLNHKAKLPAICYSLRSPIFCPRRSRGDPEFCAQRSAASLSLFQLENRVTPALSHRFQYQKCCKLAAFQLSHWSANIAMKGQNR